MLVFQHPDRITESLAYLLFHSWGAGTRLETAFTRRVLEPTESFMKGGFILKASEFIFDFTLHPRRTEVRGDA
jgi:hypothetical protein